LTLIKYLLSPFNQYTDLCTLALSVVEILGFIEMLPDISRLIYFPFLFSFSLLFFVIYLYRFKCSSDEELTDLDF